MLYSNVIQSKSRRSVIYLANNPCHPPHCDRHPHHSPENDKRGRHQPHPQGQLGGSVPQLLPFHTLDGHLQ
eukprot:1530453-Pyramimonas_sp.AAC.1